MSIDRIHRNALPKGFKLDEYVIDSVLGHGGFGITYLAKDHHLDQWVAIKEYLPNGLAVREGISTVYAKSTRDEPAFQWGLERFIHEAQTLAKFRHKAIVKVLRFIEANQTAYMVMEYQKGQSLEDKIKQEGILNEALLLAIVLPILEGLEKVHEAGFLHRDIKPSNIFICEDSAPILLDFGAARHAIQNSERSLTSIITPGYAPFEQYDSKSLQGAWTDIYALGAVMYFAISGEQPNEVVRRMKHDDMPRAQVIGAGLYHQQILKAIDWALAIDEAARPQSIKEFRQALLTNPDKLTPFSKKKNKINQLKNNLLLGFLLLTLVGGALFVYDKYRQQNTGTFVMTLLTSKNIHAFVLDYFTATARRDVDAIVRFYDDSADYYHWGWVTQETIRQDKIDFFEQWSEVKYALVNNEINVADTDKPKEKVVNYLIDFEVVRNSKAQGVKRIKGQAKHFLRIKETPFGLRIISHKERVVDRSRFND